MLKLTLILAVGCSLVRGRPEASPQPNAEPEAEADPDAIPDPLADPFAAADPQSMPQLFGAGGAMGGLMGGAMGGAGYGYGEMMPEHGGAGGQCGMVDQCCGVANEECCLGGKKCYTYYETKCERVDQPFCTRRTQEFCDTEMLPDCRTTKETKYTTIPTKVCSPPRTERKCFEYEATVCQPKMKAVTKTFTWDEQELEKTGERQVTKCHPVKTCTIKNVPYSKTIQVPEQKCEDVPHQKQECFSVPVPGQVRKVPQQAIRIEYVKRCYTVNRPICTQSPKYCTITGCQNYGDTCSQHNYQPQDICADGGGYCQQVQMPRCFQSATQCQVGMDQCCQMKQEQVCQQVPKRVPYTTYTTVQDPTTYKQQCKMVSVTKQQCRTIYNTKTIPLNRKVCENGMKEKCYDYTIPEVNVKSVSDSEDVKFDTMDCDMKQVKRQYCVDLPTKQTCQNNNVNRGVVIHKKICDRRRPAKFCSQIPISECQSTPGQQCWQVPKQVCKPTCKESNKCRMCQNFIGQGGYGQCPQSTCPNFYPPSPCGQSSCGPVAPVIPPYYPPSPPSPSCNCLNTNPRGDNCNQFNHNTCDYCPVCNFCQIKFDLVFVIDTTESVRDAQNSIQAMTHETVKIIKKDHMIIDRYLLVEFNDIHQQNSAMDQPEPYMIVTDTRDVKTFEEGVQSLKYVGGGEAHERMTKGLEAALEHCSQNSLIVVFTDTGSMNLDLVPRIKQLKEEKGATIFIMLTPTYLEEECDRDVESVAECNDKVKHHNEDWRDHHTQQECSGSDAVECARYRSYQMEMYREMAGRYIYDVGSTFGTRASQALDKLEEDVKTLYEECKILTKADVQGGMGY